jgi:hypothetical protein
MEFGESLRRLIATPEAVRLLASHIRNALAGAVSVSVQMQFASDRVILHQQPGTKVSWMARNCDVHVVRTGELFEIPHDASVNFHAIENEDRMRLDPAGAMTDIASTGLMDIQDQLQAMLTDLAHHHGGDQLVGKVVLYGNPQVRIRDGQIPQTIFIQVDWECGVVVYAAPSDPPPPTSQEWTVWAGGSDANDCAVAQVFDDEADARDTVQWMDGSRGRGLAVRMITRTPWVPVEHEHSVAWAGADNDE